MADFLDDFINISKEFGAIKDEVSDMGARLMGEEPERLIWNPADYKEYPKANPAMCVRCKYEDASCSKCLDVCPTDSIEFEDGGIEILKDCRRCGLCTQVCPTNALYISKYSADALYKEISKVAGTQNMAYVTCTRALGHVPEPSQVVLPCVGLISAEVWTSIKYDFPNVAIYLPIGICDKCRTTTGEEVYGNEVMLSEEWTDQNMDLVISEDEMDFGIRRDVERRDFVKNAAKSVGLNASKVNPITARLARVYEKLEAHQVKFDEINKSLDRLLGVKNSEKLRKLTPERQLILTTIKDHLELANRMQVEVPEINNDYNWDEEELKEVVNSCPTGALDIKDGTLEIEPTYCVSCALCVDLAPEIFRFETKSAEDAFYRFTPEAQKEREKELKRIEERKLERKEHIAKAKKLASKAANITEKIGDEFEKSDGK